MLNVDGIVGGGVPAGIPEQRPPWFSSDAQHEAFLQLMARDLGPQCITAASIDVDHLDEQGRRELLAAHSLRPTRFAALGIEGLDDAPRSGRPKTVDAAAIVAATLESPPESLAVTHWSSRLLGRHLGVGDATVARAWRHYGVKPWRRETFKFSTDPELEAKVRDVVGLYLNPPENL